MCPEQSETCGDCYLMGYCWCGNSLPGEKMVRILVLIAAVSLCSCGLFDGGDGGADVARAPDVADVGKSDLATDLGTGEADVGKSYAPLPFQVVTFNVGTSSQTLHDTDEQAGDGDGYTSTQAEYINDYLGNSLAWNPAEDALRDWLAKHHPEVVAMQELMYDPWCADAPAPPAGLGLVCEGYKGGQPLAAERLLGKAYHLAYTVGQEDLWVGVRKDFGHFRDCPETGLCTKLEGQGVFGECNESPRVTSIVVQVHDGREFVLVNAHTTAGMTEADQACRAKQIEQIFLDAGDGEPLANGAVNLVLGDMNTDPFLFAGADASANTWNQYVGPGKSFHYLSADNPEGPATHVTTMRLDHVVSDVLTGSCVVPGGSPGLPLIMKTTFFDHRPVLCDVMWTD